MNSLFSYSYRKYKQSKIVRSTNSQLQNSEPTRKNTNNKSKDPLIQEINDIQEYEAHSFNLLSNNYLSDEPYYNEYDLNDYTTVNLTPEVAENSFNALQRSKVSSSSSSTLSNTHDLSDYEGISGIAGKSKSSTVNSKNSKTKSQNLNTNSNDSGQLIINNKNFQNFNPNFFDGTEASGDYDITSYNLDDEDFEGSGDSFSSYLNRGTTDDEDLYSNRNSNNYNNNNNIINSNDLDLDDTFNIEGSGMYEDNLNMNSIGWNAGDYGNPNDKIELNIEDSDLDLNLNIPNESIDYIDNLQSKIVSTINPDGNGNVDDIDNLTGDVVLIDAENDENTTQFEADFIPNQGPPDSHQNRLNNDNNQSSESNSQRVENSDNKNSIDSNEDPIGDVFSNMNLQTNQPEIQNKRTQNTNQKTPNQVDLSNTPTVQIQQSNMFTKFLNNDFWSQKYALIAIVVGLIIGSILIGLVIFCICRKVGENDHSGSEQKSLPVVDKSLKYNDRDPNSGKALIERKIESNRTTIHNGNVVLNQKEYFA